MELNSLLEKIRSGISVEPRDLLQYLCLEGREERCAVNVSLAEAYAGIQNHEQARVFIQRAWILSDFSPDLMPLYAGIHSALDDVAAIQAAYKRLGMKKAGQNDFVEAIQYFNLSMYAHNQYQKIDRYDYDFDILERIELLARPYRFRPRSPAEPSSERKIRVAYLTYLLSNPTSVFHRINLSLAQFHEKSRFSVAFFVPEPASAFRDDEIIKLLGNCGCEVVTAPEAGGKAERMIWMAARIHKYKPDLLVTNAALANLDSYFITCMRPAATTIGLVYGPPPQFTAPSLDWCISSAKHPLMDSPCGGAFAPVEIDLPDPAKIAPCPRRQLDIPDEGFILMSCGRFTKFQDPGFWKAIFAILEAYPDLHYVALGVQEGKISFLEDLVPSGVRSRLRFLKWQKNYLPVLRLADLLIDTFPSGGGFVLMDAMAMSIPVVSFENNYMQPFDQTDWSVGVEFIPVRDLIVERGNFDQFTKVVSRLIDDESYRRQVGTRCREEITRTRGNPKRMVRRYESIYSSVLKKRVPEKTTHQSLPHRMRRRFLPRMIKTIPSSYKLLYLGWRFLARAKHFLFR